MGIFRFPIIADNTISTWSNNPSLTGLGNAGASQVVDVWAQYNIEKNKKYLTRFLAKANITALQDAISSSVAPDIINDSTVSCNLKFFNINHSESQAFDFYLNVFPITIPWVEGKGNRIDTFTNTGYSNWLTASTTASWNTAGGDYSVDSSSAQQYFESGYEDMNVNFRTMVVNWLNGSSSNHGFIVKMDGIAESLTGSSSTLTQYFRKSFHSRTTNYTNFAPYIELQWNDSITDDRKIAQFGSTVNLYFYNSPNGVYKDIDSITGSFPGKVTVSGNSVSAILSNLTASRVKTGVYKVSFTLPLTSSSFSSFQDVWSITSASSAVQTNFSMNFYPISPLSSETNYVNYDINLKIVDFLENINESGWTDKGIQRFSKNSIITKKLFIQERTANVTPLVQSELNSISSIAASTIPSYITSNGSWRVIVDALSIPDIDWQPLSYDSNSNFFTIDTSNFIRNVKYKFQFKLNIRGQNIIFDNDPAFFFIVE